MKKLLFVLALYLSASTGSFAQKTPLQVTINENTVGYNTQDNSDIKGIEYAFSDRISECFLDTVSGFLTVQLRGVSKNGKWLNNTGQLVQYDLANQQVLWNKNMTYLSSDLKQFNNTMILTTGNKSQCLDINTGKECWTVKNQIYHVNPIEHIGIGYKYKTIKGYTNELEGIDLDNGNVLWGIDLNREYGWNNLFYTNDSTIIIVASGLHAINIKTGNGWDYNTVTGQKDYTATTVANVAGVALGLLTGTFVISTGHDLVRDIVSNVLEDSLYFYFSSKEQVAKIDKQNGEVIWKYSFPKNLVSKSSVFMENNLIVMINKGFAFIGNRQIDFGNPFIAAFDKETGQEKFIQLIPEKKKPLLDFLSRGSELFLVFENKLTKYSKETGELIAEKDFPDKDFGKLKYFVGNQAFIANKDSAFISLPQTDTNNVFVLTEKGSALVIDDQLNIVNTIDSNDLSVGYLKHNDYKFIAKNDKTWIINSAGKKVAELNVNSRAFLINNILYNTQNNRFIAIDLEKILQ